MSLVIEFADPNIPKFTLQYANGYQVSQSIIDMVRQYLSRGEKVGAVKEVRNITSFGLYESKQIVEHIEKNCGEQWLEIYAVGGPRDGMRIMVIFDTGNRAQLLIDAMRNQPKWVSLIGQGTMAYRKLHGVK